MPYPGRENIYKATIRRMVSEALAEQERLFRERHESDSEEMLLDYLRHCAAELGHTPWPEEIDGGAVLRERFGTWQNAVRSAGLPEPRSADRLLSFDRVQRETLRQQERYRQKKREKKARTRQRDAERKVKKRNEN